jgi:hypothetical protein
MDIVIHIDRDIHRDRYAGQYCDGCKYAHVQPHCCGAKRDKYGYGVVYLYRSSDSDKYFYSVSVPHANTADSDNNADAIGRSGRYDHKDNCVGRRPGSGSGRKVHDNHKE